MEGIKSSLNPSRFWILVGASFLLCLVCVLLFPLIGPYRLSLVEALWQPDSLDAEILFRARLPRTLFAALVGGALAVSGVVFQAILRNPLASPFTLGVSGGGALGAVVAILFGWQAQVFGVALLPAASLTGALAVVFLVYGLSRWAISFTPVTLLLAGVVLNYICAALILLIHYFADFTQGFLMMRWMMGGLDIFEYGVLISVLPFLALGLLLVLPSARSLNVLSAGEEWAESRGVRVRRLIKIQYFGASLLTGSVVAFSGPIGFVGLIVPHTLRLLIGPDHRLLLPVSFFAGGSFLIVCDTAARTLLAPTEIPVGILTAILGGPFFLWLLLRRKGSGFF